MTTMAACFRRAQRYTRTPTAKLDHYRRQQRAQRALQRFTLPYKLNLGCRNIPCEGWVNIDRDNSSGKADLEWDLTHGLPVETHSCEFFSRLADLARQPVHPDSR